MIRTLLVVLPALLFAASGWAQTPDSARTTAPRKEIRAVRLQGRVPTVDGVLDDAAWAAAPVMSDFVQKQPNEGAAPTDRTELRFVYDDHALYVAARMFSRDPAAIRAPVSRRDNGAAAEHVWISLDTYLDRRTAYSFGVTAAGTRMDWYHARDDEYDLDLSFDPVWQAEVSRDSLGWTAEMRIPFSQLRFNARDEQTWGLNVDRWNPGTQEDVFWIAVPTQETGWASRFGTLTGIRGIRPARRAEILPYVASSGTFTGAPGAGNPFDDGSTLEARVGADLKMGVGPNLTLEGTVNPDFGQVELDPAQVNLSAYEAYFDERRPFFIEGKQLLAGSGPEYFYSRRIGGIPDVALSRLEVAGDFQQWPRNSAILGAAKLTGRLSTGTSVGALAAVTDDAYARGFDVAGDGFDRVRVAPRTGYGVARAQQEFGASQSTAGVLLTAVHRDMEDDEPLAQLLNRDALAGGGDWNLRFRGGEYSVSGYAGFSYVAGDSLALLRNQRSSVRFFQRPDQDYVRVDPSRTSLGGYTAQLQVARESGRHWLWVAQASGQSPGLELNDAGFMGRADEVFGYGNLRYRETQPGKLFRRYDIGLTSENTWNFGRTRTFSALRTDMRFTWKSFWTTTLIAWKDMRALSDSYTRGGPLAGTPASWRAIAAVGMPESWMTRASGQVTVGRGEEGSKYLLFTTALSARPGPRWQLSVEPLWRRMTDPRQYVASLPGGPDATYGRRYTFASVDQTIVSAATRLNYLFTPDLSLEFYMEPFAANGRYESFGQLRAPGALRLDGTGGRVVSERGEHFFVGDADEDGDGELDRQQIASDFTIRSFRSNAVMRWEWRPGSTFFLVWQQDRSASELGGNNVGFGALGDTFGARGDNVLALKMSYWIPIR
ncbi:DUF5916 domain-containing protein [Longimicrobium terrae]|uniref:DUF5916 domain-containing protein n=1 Tax=Longimicrobium terrae TaxID=1639882 RepID=A0A841GR19_9BACT|nr:hypothetical protein [Longimicrobium terrae]MBB6068669.1 hypothetical protein [Longimicrobium terrae]NNC27855.1 carbohydrate binding family 9 domain-containing protein [Longimicrobium terrae]